MSRRETLYVLSADDRRFVFLAGRWWRVPAWMVSTVEVIGGIGVLGLGVLCLVLLLAW